METIRIVRRKRNRGSGSILWVLLVIVILGAIAWLLVDQDVIDSESFAVRNDSVETEENRRYGEYRNSDELRNDNESEGVEAYVSFVNREVVPSDSIEKQMKQKALTLFQRALSDVSDEGEISDANDEINLKYRERRDNEGVSGTLYDSVEQTGTNVAQRSTSDTTEWPTGEDNQQYVDNSLVEAGNRLVDLQEQEYPSLSKMGDGLKKCLNDLEKTDTEDSEQIKDFFIASSSLLQEMDSERSFDRISYTKKRR